MKSLIFKLFVGKNIPALVRWGVAALGGVILGSVLYSTGNLPEILANSPQDAVLGDAFNEIVPTADEVKDGLTLEETVGVVFGFLLIWVSRITSLLRAKNLDWLADVLGVLIGRSIHSLFRCAMDASSGLLLYVGIKGSPDLPLAGIGEAIILFFASRIYSAIEDGKRNPA